jgi:protein TonB
LKQYFTTKHKAIWLVLLASGLGAEKSVAQQNIPPAKTEYFDTNGKIMPSAAGARYRRETVYTDSIGGTVQDYYVGGILQEIKSFDNIRKEIPNGTFESWHENGKLASHQEFVHGKQIGERRFYYESGQLKRHEQYQEGKRTAGECYDAQGGTIAFFEYEVMPIYPEGKGDQLAIVNAVARSIRYPKDALKAGVQGRVFVKFQVDKTGQVIEVELVKGLFPSLDAETVRAVRQLRRFKPGLQDGLPVTVSYTLPIRYGIDPSRTSSLFGGIRTTYELPKE